MIPLWVIIALPGKAQEVHFPLNDGWHFSQVGKEQWYSAQVPGVVQTDLVRHGLIPDFMQGRNIERVQWVEHEDWVYRRTITVTDDLLRHDQLDLVFKGLDTFAEVYVNDSMIGRGDNMFRTWEWPVKGLLRKGDNKLQVIFRSPIKAGAKLRDAYGIQLPHDSDPSGVSPYIRKAAYQFGWDFCPRLVTSGIWKDVVLRAWSTTRIERFDVDAVPNADTMALSLRVVLPGQLSEGYSVRFLLNDLMLAQVPVREVEGRSVAEYVVGLALVERWWPAGEGERPLHVVAAEVVAPNGDVIAKTQRTTGFRSVELRQVADTIGTSFTFCVNGREIFMKGCNVVPPSMVPIYDAPWLKLVEQMHQAGMNMARVWSGGVYPPDAFFDACDTAGIMVWQDYMVGNLPPGNQAFLANLSSEVGQQLQRMRHHPSLAVFCGDNELDVAWKNWGWQERYHLHGVDSIRALEGYRAVQRQLAIITHDGVIPYTPTSPLSNWGNAQGLTEGDLHYWGVWHGDSAFSSFQNNIGRFVSEYGFQSYPDSALLAMYIDPDSLVFGSSAVVGLQRSYKTDQPIREAIDRELSEEQPTTFGGFVEASQRAQAKAYSMAIEAHMAAQPLCMGTLLWQLNDCWPGPSWSIIDFAGNPKPAYVVVKGAFKANP